MKIPKRLLEAAQAELLRRFRDESLASVHTFADTAPMMGMPAPPRVLPLPRYRPEYAPFDVWTTRWTGRCPVVTTASLREDESESESEDDA